MATLGSLGSRKMILDKAKMDAYNTLNGNKEQPVINYEVELIENVNPVNRYNIPSNNGTAVVTVNNCRPNPICNCDVANTKCSLNIRTCEATITNVTRDTTCTLNYLQN